MNRDLPLLMLVAWTPAAHFTPLPGPAGPADELVLYIEVSDVPAAVAAYEQTALYKLMGNEPVAEAAGGLLSGASLSSESILGTALAGAPLDEAQQLLQGISTEDLSSLSLQVTAGELEPGALFDTLLSGAGVPGDAGLLLELELRDVDTARQLVQDARQQFGSEVEWTEREGRTVGRMQSPDPRLGNLGLVHDGARIALCLGNTDPAEHLAPAAGIAAGRLAPGRALFRGEGVVLAEIYSSLGPRLLGDLPASLSESGVALLEALCGTTASIFLRGGHWRIAVTEEGRFVTEGLHARTDAEQPSLFGARPLDEAALQLLSPEALVGWITTVEGAALAEALAGEGVLPEGFPEELLSTLGDTLCLSLPRLKSLLNAPPLLLTLTLDDAQRCSELLSAWGQAGAGDEGDPEAVRITEYRDERIYSLPIDLSGLFEVPLIDLSSFLRPAVTVTGGNLLVASSVTQAKRELRRLKGRRLKTHALLEDAPFPEDALSVGYAHWAQYLAAVYNGVRALASMGLAEVGADISQLPKADELIADFRPTLRWVREADGGVLHYQESSFGPEASALLAGAILFFFLDESGVEDAVTVSEDEDWEEDPQEDQVEDPQEDQVSDDLVRLASGVSAYSARTGTLPGTLEDIRQEPAFADPLPLDPWGNAYLYEPRGEAFKLWSAGPDGADQQGRGDDIAVTFN